MVDTSRIGTHSLMANAGVPDRLFLLHDHLFSVSLSSRLSVSKALGI